MKRNIVIPSSKINEVKKLLSNKAGLREAARLSGISYYTVWCISKGKYDSDRPLQAKHDIFNCCPITGFKLSA